MSSEAVEAMLGSRRAFAIAAAGCGKTELLARFVEDGRSGRQLILTHTHAGVAALRKRLTKMGVPREKYHLDTIAGWSLKYCAAYPNISGYRLTRAAKPDWIEIYQGAERVCRSGLGKRVIRESYDGVIVDEYQDCVLKQHAIMTVLGDCIPCRGVGDPLQTVFGFRKDDPVIPWDTVWQDFEVIPDALRVPWRWRREGHNERLGEWLVAVRKQIETGQHLEIAKDAPVTWLPWTSDEEVKQQAAACSKAGQFKDSVAAILRRPNRCPKLAQRLGGRWPIVERFDDGDLLDLGQNLARAEGRDVVFALVDFVGARMTKMKSELSTIVRAVAAGRDVSRIEIHREHADRLYLLAQDPTPARALAWLEGVLAHKEWVLYRDECVYQLRSALRECMDLGFAKLPELVSDARTRARHRGRLTHRRTIGTPLLLKGLEFDHAVVLWEPEHFSVQELYVAITRASKSLTIVSQSRTLCPNQEPRQVQRQTQEPRQMQWLTV